MLHQLLTALLLTGVGAQHYCWPCAVPHGVIGKWTTSASDSPAAYAWYMTYLNNIRAGANNTGDGTHTYWKAAWQEEIIESWDIAPNVMAMEVNECGTFIGDYEENVSNPMTSAEEELVAQGLRLPTGDMHQCTCSLQGRAHVINGTVDPAIWDWDAVSEAWGVDYTAAAAAAAQQSHDDVTSTMDDEEAAAYSLGNIFGVHAVGCPFHSSGPCLLADVERGVRRAVGAEANFSQGYVPLMDNNLLLWVEDLGPLLDAFLRDGVHFFPMVWNASAPAASSAASTAASSAAAGNGTRAGAEAESEEVFSVLASPGGKILLEVASRSSGGRPRGQFHAMPHVRAVLDPSTASVSAEGDPGRLSNDPLPGTGDAASRPLAPLRVSRAVGPNAGAMEATLAFYGVGDRPDEAALGFGRARVLRDETGANGAEEKRMRSVAVLSVLLCAVCAVCVAGAS